MNEKTRIQIENLKNQTIGVEIEMNHITRKKAAQVAADFFGTGRFEDTASRNGYYTWSAWDSQNREWKFQRDVSIAGSDSEKCEMSSPNSCVADCPSLAKFSHKLLQGFDVAVVENRCGVHYVKFCIIVKKKENARKQASSH